jgi:hypothetical protein
LFQRETGGAGPSDGSEEDSPPEPESETSDSEMDTSVGAVVEPLPHGAVQTGGLLLGQVLVPVAMPVLVPVLDSAAFMATSI